METLLILVKLICAHLCSDFIFQTDKINGGKLKPGIKGIAFQMQDESELSLHIPCRPVLSYYGNCSAVVSPLWQRE